MSELKKFFKENYYVLIIWIIALIPILYSYWLSAVEILIIFVSHFIADIFMTFMVINFSKWNMLKWYIHQFMWSFIFLLIWLYSFYFHSDAIYLIPSFVYFPVILKNIYELYYKKEIKIINMYTLWLYGWSIFTYALCKYEITDISTIIQFIGVLFFAVILNIKNQKTLRIMWIIMVSFMILWWILKLYNEIVLNNILNGATFSYTILPLVVLISFIKNKIS